MIFREKTNDERIQTILEYPSDCPQVNALRLSEMVDEPPFVELNYYMCTGPTANYVWSLDNRNFISVQQILDRMKIADTLTPCVPALFNQVQKTTSLSYRSMCDELRPIVNTPGHFSIDEHGKLAPQPEELKKKANECARVIDEQCSDRALTWRVNEQQQECEVDGNPDEGMLW